MNYCVFQYETDMNIEGARKSLVDLVFQCLDSDKPITKTEFYARIPKLLYGGYPARAEKSVKASLDALLWKYSELTGKYCGCQYWSVKAKSLFDRKLGESMSGTLPSREGIRHLANFLSKKIHREFQLVHEHVFPRAELVALLREPKASRTWDSVNELMERLAVACVVLQSEHGSLKKKDLDRNNPWLRYRGKIQLAENVHWLASQRELIVAAGLL